MKRVVTLALGLMLAVGSVVAGELKSGLQPGDLVGEFEVEKCGGAVNDGRDVGTNFCYRCMLGSKPVVMVFARKANGDLAKLVKELDQAVQKNAEKMLSSFVNLLGKEPEALKMTAKEFAAKNRVENVALVVPQDNENGPEDFNIHPEAEVTVILYREGKVEVNHAYAAGQLGAEAVKQVIADTSKILN